ncbi:MAG: bifunctional phosphoglucose/phosphomannose isomerase [Patescibacteria group bacterium]|jgi:glucose/mannose-6-phosphate isomerase|nr:bifunctional phosphoglucose/phosphomannose isomerase [Patescibacteria group bacterium]
MLDDLKLIHTRDAQDALGIAEKQWQQIAYEFPQVQNVDYTHIENIVFAGMGGSALGALLSTAWPGYNHPFEICRNYNLPGYVGKKTLVIASSYSGNTEETIEALQQAESKGASIAVVASGGKLKEIALDKGYPFVELPQAGQPRYATLYGFKGLLSLLADGGFIDKSIQTELANQADWFKNQLAGWRPDVATKDNYAKQIALEVIGKAPVIYSSTEMFPAAYKWKISFNENAKNIAWCNMYPEFNHNEFLGWSSHPLDKPYAVIDLRSNLDHPRVQKRFDLSAKLISGKRPAPITVDLVGETLLQQLLYAVALGDFVSLYTGILNGLNPSPVDLIEKFKKELS